MDKLLYQIRIKERDMNEYILGRISGMLDFITHTYNRINATDVLWLNGEWIFNFQMEEWEYHKVRSYITVCYPGYDFKYFKYVNDEKIEL